MKFGIYGPSGTLLAVTFDPAVAEAIADALAATAFQKVGFVPTYRIAEIDDEFQERKGDEVR